MAPTYRKFTLLIPIMLFTLRDCCCRNRLFLLYYQIRWHITCDTPKTYLKKTQHHKILTLIHAMRFMDKRLVLVTVQDANIYEVLLWALTFFKFRQVRHLSSMRRCTLTSVWSNTKEKFPHVTAVINQFMISGDIVGELFFF